MVHSPAPPGVRIVSFIDIGTNSTRLLVARINKDCSYTILSRQKQLVRLGEGEFSDNILRDDAMDRGVIVTSQFIKLARSFGTEEVVAVATSATRDAVNRNTFLGRLRRETGVDVRVISGREEARLIYLGVSSGINLGDQQALFIDIGGGSTEIAIGSQHCHFFLDSIDLGSIRLSNMFFPAGNVSAVGDSEYQRICNYIRNAMADVIRECRHFRIDRVIGSSGTVVNLGEIARRASPNRNDEDTIFISRTGVESVSALLRSLPLKDRKRVPGINPDRADIIVCGTAILEILLQELAVDRIAVSNRGLQDGLIVDYLSQMEYFPHISDLSVRQRSIVQIGHSYGINEFHARNVTRIALNLFDTAQTLDLHRYENWERELLEYASFLHDIGSFISYSNHHLHSAYIIENTDFPGFRPGEIVIMAKIAQFHRKKPPARKHPDLGSLDAEERERVIILSFFLRLAESLDRSHMGLVMDVRFTGDSGDRVNLNIHAPEDCHLEMKGVENESANFERIFRKKMVLQIQNSGHPDI
jgi:exopolyphosphatase / guanosine-5'-triphosphate,3'-diphosphate pyrophosphatase